MEFTDKFIAFIDILGFKAMIEAAEQGQQPSLTEIRKMLSDLERKSSAESYATCGPTVCPDSSFIQKNLDFRVTQVSDCVIVSAEVSPAGAINIVDHCFAVSLKLLTQGILVRGYITRGSVYHEGTDFFGSGYHEALKKEAGVCAFSKTADEKGTPFIEIDSSVFNYIQDETDSCIRTMFSRLVKEDDTLKAI